MRKSPLSAPGGSGGKRNYNTNSPSPRRHGYNGIQDCLGSDTNHQQSSTHKNDDGFIPLGFSSPMNQHQHHHRYQHQNHWRGSKGWQGRRGVSTNNAGYNNQRNNSYNNTPNSSYNDSNSPGCYFKKQNFAHRRPRQKDAHRQVDIGNYVNVRSMLEDPWADLMRKFEYGNTENRTEKILTVKNFEIGIDESGNNIDVSNCSEEILDSEIGTDTS